MKKHFVWLLPLLALSLVGCASDATIEYSDDLPLTFELDSSHLRILQVTDLHLTYGIDRNDQKTFELIEALATQTSADIIVITGDLTMSPLAPSLYESLTRRIDKIGIPWTFNFGNHDTDFNNYKRNLDAIERAKPENLLFKIGPKLVDGGFGNFIIDAMYQDEVFHRLYLLDSKTENGALMEYGWLSEAQVAWYANHAAQDAINDINSTIYMHIPLLQFEEYTEYPLIDGQMGEDKVYPQGQDTGLFDAIVTHDVSSGVFVGHDHLSNFSFVKDGVLLAYGQTSGYNGYGIIDRGGRLIDVDQYGTMTSFLMVEAEVTL